MALESAEVNTWFCLADDDGSIFIAAEYHFRYNRCASDYETLGASPLALADSSVTSSCVFGARYADRRRPTRSVSGGQA